MRLEKLTVADPDGFPTFATGRSASAKAWQLMVLNSDFTFARSSPDGLFAVCRFTCTPMCLAENKPFKIALVNPDSMFQFAVTDGFKRVGHGCGDAPQRENTTGPSRSVITVGTARDREAAETKLKSGKVKVLVAPRTYNSKEIPTTSCACTLNCVRAHVKVLEVNVCGFTKQGDTIEMLKFCTSAVTAASEGPIGTQSIVCSVTDAGETLLDMM